MTALLTQRTQILKNMLAPEFLSSIRDQLGSAFPAFLEAMEAPSTPAVHINSLRPGSEALMRPYIADRVSWAGDCYYLGNGRPGATPWHDLGACYLQEASAMAPATVLDAQTDEKILDLCAAPGGKSFQIACQLHGTGTLVCNEPIPSRAKVLAENLERLGVVNAVVVNAYPEELAVKWPEYFDAILVDAPCSGEGMFRRSPSAAAQWKPSLPEGCARRQKAILEDAWRMLKPGGRLIYSTCTFNNLENEDVIQSFLEKHAECMTVDFSLTGVGDSREGMLRLWPHLLRGEGHFVAKIQKMRSTPHDISRRKEKKYSSASSPLEKDDRILIKQLEETICQLPGTLESGHLLRQADYIHMLPAGAPPLNGIRTVKPGLCLIRAGRSHIQPMPALARACGSGTDFPWLAQAKRECPLTEEEYHHMRSSGFEKPYLPESAWILYTLKSLPVCFIKGGPAGTKHILY